MATRPRPLVRSCLPALPAVLLVLPAALLSGCATSSGAPPPYQATIAGMTRAIEQHMVDAQVTGLAIALVDGDHVVWARGFGWADEAAGRPATADTVFEIGSVSKTLAAATVMQLVEEGRMDLDDRLDRHVPAFRIRQGPFESGPVTIRSVLTHHSGIPSDLFNGAFTEGQPFDYDDWLLDWLVNEHTSAPVGAVLAYSNSAFALLRRAIDLAAPEGFAARSNALFDSMGMRSTSYALDDRIRRDRVSQGYDAGQVRPRMYGNLSTAGTILSSASDMARYLRTLLAGGVAPGGARVLATASVDQMFSRQNRDAPFDLDTGIGLSWFLGPADFYAGRRAEHEGSSPWFHSMVRIFPDHRLGVVVLSNCNDADVNGLSLRTLEMALEEKTGAVPPTPVPAPSEPDPGWTAEQLRALEGTYVGPGEGLGIATFTVSAVPGGLSFSNRTGTWIPRKNGYFSRDGGADPQRLQLRFQRIEGRDVVVALFEGERLLYAERFVPVEGPLLAAWEARTGRYVATNLNPGAAYWPGPNTMFLAVDENRILRVFGTFRGDVALLPTSSDLALVAGIGRNRGESVRVVTVDGEEQVELWGYRYRRTP